MIDIADAIKNKTIIIIPARMMLFPDIFVARPSPGSLSTKDVKLQHGVTIHRADLPEELAGLTISGRSATVRATTGTFVPPIVREIDGNYQRLGLVFHRADLMNLRRDFLIAATAGAIRVQLYEYSIAAPNEPARTGLAMSLRGVDVDSKLLQVRLKMIELGADPIDLASKTHHKIEALIDRENFREDKNTA